MDLCSSNLCGLRGNCVCNAFCLSIAHGWTFGLHLPFVCCEWAGMNIRVLVSVGVPTGNSFGFRPRVVLFQEGGPLPGPETGLLSNTQKWIVQGDTCADKSRDFIGKGHPGGEQEGKGTQENCSAAWLAVSGFMVMGLVSGWSLANHSNSESFLVVHASLSQDGC